MTREAFLNALTIDMALGCSTNSMLHLPAIAHECDITLDLDLANEISEKTPNLCHLAPAGPHYVEDLNRAGGIRAVMHEISKPGLLHTNLMTCTGRTIAENIKDCEIKDPEVIRPFQTPYSPTGGIAVLKGNLAPDGCVVKRSAVSPEMMKHTGRARVFNSEEEALQSIYQGLKMCIRDRDISVVSLGDTKLAEIISPKLTTARYFYRESGVEAAEMLLEMMEGKNLTARVRKMGFEVICRETV